MRRGARSSKDKIYAGVRRLAEHFQVDPRRRLGFIAPAISRLPGHLAYAARLSSCLSVTGRSRARWRWSTLPMKKREADPGACWP